MEAGRIRTNKLHSHGELYRHRVLQHGAAVGSNRAVLSAVLV
jgi:hypothetical protein